MIMSYITFNLNNCIGLFITAYFVINSFLAFRVGTNIISSPTNERTFYLVQWRHSGRASEPFNWSAEQVRMSLEFKNLLTTQYKEKQNTCPFYYHLTQHERLSSVFFICFYTLREK